MLKSSINSARREKSRLLKQCRELYNISVAEIQLVSKLSTETIYRLEGGLKPWTIDTEILYLQSLNEIIDGRDTGKTKLMPYNTRPLLLQQQNNIHILKH